MMSLECFSVDKAPTAQRSTLFRTQMQKRFSVGLDIEGIDGEPLSTHVAGYSGPSLRFATLRLSAHTTSAVPGSVSSNSRLVVTMQDEGVANIFQDGRQADVTPGHFCLIDPDRPFRIETTNIRTRSIYLDRASLLATLPQITSLTALSVSGVAGVGTLFRSLLDELFQIAPSLDEDTADSIADALPYVLATSLQSLKRDLGPPESRLRLFHKQRIRRFARGSLRDPRLDAKMIARGVNLSTRYIRQIYSDETPSLMRWVWAERLEHCRRDLKDAAFRHRSISEIAFGWGFSDVAHFSRSFRQRIGISPREYRRTTAA